MRLQSDDNDDLTQDLISSFQYIPYEVLLGSIFPYLSLKTINRLCTVNSLFNDLCNDETLWKIKITNEYSTLVNNKPLELSWRDYYRSMVSKIVPIYYHGDRIGTIMVMLGELKETAIILAQNYQKSIAFINSHIKIIAAMQYPDMLFRDFSLLVPDNNPEKEIFKIVIMDDAPLNLSESIRGVGRKPPVGILISSPRNNRIIYSELTSPLGNPPIYGLYEEFKSAYALTARSVYLQIRRGVILLLFIQGKNSLVLDGIQNILRRCCVN